MRLAEERTLSKGKASGLQSRPEQRPRRSQQTIRKERVGKAESAALAGVRLQPVATYL